MKKMSLAAIAAVVLLTACGDMGGVLNPNTSSGGNYPSSPSTYSQEFVGTVSSVDSNNKRIDVTVNSVNGRSVNPYTNTFYYDNRTRVVYNGQTTYTPQNLERGDQIDVQLTSSNNNQALADTITVVGDVRNQNGYPTGSTNPTYPNGTQYPAGTYPNNQMASLQGTVSYVDTNAQRIDVTSGYVTGLRTSQTGGTYSVFYGSNTPVLFQGQTFRPADLERGDQVDIRFYAGSNGQYQADSITVTRNVRQ